PEREIMIKNANAFATHQAVWVLRSPIGVLNDGDANMLAAVSIMPSEIRVSGVQSEYPPVTSLDPNAIPELARIRFLRFSSGTIAAHSSGTATSKGSGIGSFRSPAKHAAITSIARFSCC